VPVSLRRSIDSHLVELCGSVPDSKMWTATSNTGHLGYSLAIVLLIFVSISSGGFVSDLNSNRRLQGWYFVLVSRAHHMLTASCHNHT